MDADEHCCVFFHFVFEWSFYDVEKILDGRMTMDDE
jgi:hypothetical protein